MIDGIAATTNLPDTPDGAVLLGVAGILGCLLSTTNKQPLASAALLGVVGLTTQFGVEVGSVIGNESLGIPVVAATVVASILHRLLRLLPRCQILKLPLRSRRLLDGSWGSGRAVVLLWWRALVGSGGSNRG